MAQEAPQDRLESIRKAQEGQDSPWATIPSQEGKERAPVDPEIAEEAICEGRHHRPNLTNPHE